MTYANYRESRRDDGEAENVIERTLRKSRHNTIKLVNIENRQGKGGPFQHFGSHLQGPDLPAR